LNTYSWWS